MTVNYETGEIVETYSAQYRDWSEQWCSDNTMHATKRGAFDHCLGVLVQNGYSGADVRVLRHTTERTVEVCEGVLS